MGKTFLCTNETKLEMLGRPIMKHTENRTLGNTEEAPLCSAVPCLESVQRTPKTQYFQGIRETKMLHSARKLGFPWQVICYCNSVKKKKNDNGKEQNIGLF